MAMTGLERRTVWLLFGLSGACGLTYEVLWMRSLTNLLGGTVYGTSAVLAAFMGGMALGSFAAGRLAERSGSPLRLYGLLEIAIGLSALTVPFMLDRLAPFCRALLHPVSDGGTPTLLVRFAASSLLLLPTTILMGATLPILSRLFAIDRTQVGGEGGRLYAWNTFGAVAGTLTTGFVLIRWLGISTTHWLAVALNVLIGGIALGLAARWERASTSRGAPPRVSPEPPPEGEHRRSGLGQPGWVLALIGVSGFSALAYEVLWTRMLSLITFNTVFAFTSMLAAFLIGIALGSYLLARALRRNVDPWLWLGVLQLAIGVYALLSPSLFGALAESFYNYQNTIAASDAAAGSFLLRQFLLSEAIMLLPTMLMGASFPLACEIHALGTGKTAGSVGEVYASNTVGAIAGSTLTGLVLIPAIGLKGGLLTAALLNLAAAVLSLSHSRRRPRAALAIFSAVTLGAGLVFAGTDASFRARSTGEGMEIVFQFEDATGIAEVFERDGSRWLVTNRLHTEGSNLPAEIYKMKKQGYLPLLLHPDPRSVIEIGLGTGIGFAPVALDERVARAGMVEISAGVVAAAAAWFGDESGNVLEHPKVEVKIDDGRNYMLLTPTRYDLIVLGLFTPYRSGAGYLFSREFYESCHDQLEPGGMVMHWLPLGQMSLASLRIMLRTFHSVFPQVYLWDKGSFVGVLGLTEPLRVDAARVRRTLASPSMREDLETWQLDDPYNYLASFLMGSAEVEAFARGAELNTEDRPRIEFSDVKAFRAAYSPVYAAENLAALLDYRRPPDGLLTGLSAEESAELERYHQARGHALRGLVHEGRGELEAALASFNRALELNPRDDIAWFEIAKYLR